jgi:ribose-phosphate pyrophosphokinase
MIKLISDGEEVSFTITIFPDGTSQVWKIDESKMDPNSVTYILWLFENEAELIQVCQVAQLCYDVFDTSVDLVCPYLPYARQDKEVNNKLSFALKTFTEILYNAGITRIEAFDPHSKSDLVFPMESTTPKEFHQTLFNTIGYDFVCYPDKGAAERYAKTTGKQFIWCEKVRNQQTGEITGLKVNTSHQDLYGKSVLIIDDICDGGMTFIKVAEALKEYKTGPIDLAVSHGLFSKGKQVLFDAGIRDIHTTNSLLRNPEGYKVW